MDRRPNPDEILAKLKNKEEESRRGRLKIFFGACAGVGKTYTMLSEAHLQRAQNLDVVVGLIETHGRNETAELLKGLEILPTKTIEYRGKLLQEFDLDSALARKPSIILIDELAHTNVKGSRHTKRWQDVEELLNNGIDVYTTVNVQHLESLNDVISHITGIHVTETFPDDVFNKAAEVKLVDLPPDELLARLKEGKVYIPEHSKHAIENFFRKGNLIALRELALRRMADRVDLQMREYRDDQAIERVWQTKERILVCVGPEESSEKIIRKAYRFAVSLHADWFAVYVETPALQKLSKNKRDQILKNLKLAQELGAETNILAGADLSEILIAYARSNNIAKIIVGKPQRSRLSRLWRPTLSEALTNKQSDIDIYIVERMLETEDEQRPVSKSTSLEFEVPDKTYWPGYGWATATCVIATVISAIFINFLSLSNIALLYVLGIALIASKYGRGPSILASFISVAIFDLYFVAPKWSFVVSNSQYFLTFLVMLAVALIISNLTSSLRYQARIAMHRERRTNAANALSKELASVLTLEQINEISIRHLSTVFQAKFSLLLPDANNKVHPQREGADPNLVVPNCDLAIAQWVYDNQQPAGLGTQTLPAAPILYFPLRAPMRIRGVLAIDPNHPEQIFLPEQQRLLDAFAAQIALSIEHIHYIEMARDALLTMESERLRDALLNAISHALYSPLTTILDLSHTLLKSQGLSEASRQESVLNIYERAEHMHGLVTNLLDMARLQMGEIELNKQWCSLNEIIQKALKNCQKLLKSHHVKLLIPSHLALIHFDPVLMERVFYHLLENASQYTPPGSHIEISAEQHQHTLIITMQDDGPGLPPGMEEKIFEKFIRGASKSMIPGVGLGLALCRTILEAHGGEISAENRLEGGTKFIITIPLGSPPKSKS